jgi:hypothetical protein
VNLGSRGRVLVAVSLAAALAFMVAAHGAAHTAPRTGHVVAVATAGLPPPIVDD